MEQPRADQILDFSMPDGSNWRLAGWGRTKAWLTELATFWDWLPSSRVPDPANIVGNSPHRYQQVMADAESLKTSGRPPRDLLPSINQWFAGRYVLPHPRSERGKLISAVREEAGDEAALFAFAVLDGVVSPNAATTVAQFRGAMLAISPEISKVVPKARNLSEERRRFESTLAALQHEEDVRQLERERLWNESLIAAGEAALRWSQRRARRYQKHLIRARRGERKAIDSIKGVETAYREQMGLAAPVEYWKVKAAQHRTSELWARVWVIAFFVVTLPGMAYVFNETGEALIRQALEVRPEGAAPFPNAIFLIASAGLASCAGVVFWAGRLLTKLYLSQHHLRQDAEERATMTETYLALIENSAASTEDRQVILNALFRNTPDGIVKEEGGLDPSIAAALGKFLAKP